MSVILDFFKSGYGKIAMSVCVLFLLFLGGRYAFKTMTVHQAKKVAVDWTQEKVQFTGEDLPFTDSTGKRTEHEKPENVGDVEQTVTVPDSSGKSRKLFVEQTGSWFPEITGKPTARIGALGSYSSRGIVATNQTPSLIGFDESSLIFGGGYSFGSGPAVFGAYTPIRIWAFRFGPAFTYTSNKDFSIQGAVTVEVRESLYLNVSVTPDMVIGGEDKQLFVGLGYRF